MANFRLLGGLLCFLLLFSGFAGQEEGGSPLLLQAEKEIRDDLQMRKGTSFVGVPASWGRKYGTFAVRVLSEIVHDEKLEETQRYVALMGAVQLGGYGMASRFSELLEDSSWLLRSAELRALKATGRDDPGITPAIGRKIVARLTDPALVVRMEAVEAIGELRPKGAVSALLSTLQDERNYPGGVALWVPQKALRVLSEIGGAHCLPGKFSMQNGGVHLGLAPGSCTE